MILPGEVILKLREHVLPHVAIPAGIANGGIIKHQKGYLCLLRNCSWSYADHFNEQAKTPTRPIRSYIYAVWLTENLRYQYASHIAVADLPKGTKQSEVAFEDPRLFRMKKGIMVLMSRSHRSRNGVREYDQYLGELDINTLCIKKLPLRHCFYSPQKNWNPFVYKETLYLEYYLNPRVVLLWNEKSESPAHPNVIIDTANNTQPIKWDLQYKICRNSAPPVFLEELGVWLASYHTFDSHDRAPFRDYYQIFALLRPDPPFLPKAITPKFKLVSDTPDQQVQFLMGMVQDRLNPDNLVLSYGVADYDNYIARIPLGNILDRMKIIS